MPHRRRRHLDIAGSIATAVRHCYAPQVASDRIVPLAQIQLAISRRRKRGHEQQLQCRLLGIFLPAFHVVWLIVYVMTILILVGIFSGGAVFAFQQKSIPDVVIDLSLGMVLLVVSLLPLWIQWRHA